MYQIIKVIRLQIDRQYIKHEVDIAYSHTLNNNGIQIYKNKIYIDEIIENKKYIDIIVMYMQLIRLHNLKTKNLSYDVKCMQITLTSKSKNRENHHNIENMLLIGTYKKVQ